MVYRDARGRLGLAGDACDAAVPPAAQTSPFRGHRAAFRNHALGQALSDKGIDGCPDVEPAWPRHARFLHGLKSPVVQFLLGKGADCTIKNDWVYTPETDARAQGHAEVAAALTL